MQHPNANASAYAVQILKYKKIKCKCKNYTNILLKIENKQICNKLAKLFMKRNNLSVNYHLLSLVVNLQTNTLKI